MKRLEPLGVFERVLLCLFVASLATAMLSPSPLLQTKALTIETRVFPNANGHEMFDWGALHVTSAAKPGCIELRASNTIVVCNPHLSCEESPHPSIAFQVFQLGPDSFYVEGGSTCNSVCCDWRGMSFTAEGKRLDDAFYHRIFLRLGILGGAACLIGLYGLAQYLRGVPARIKLFGGLGLAIAFLWWNF